MCGCGKPALKGGDWARSSCATKVAGDFLSADSKEFKQKMSLWDEQGRNKNGIRYDEFGKRIWD